MQQSPLPRAKVVERYRAITASELSRQSHTRYHRNMREARKTSFVASPTVQPRTHCAPVPLNTSTSSLPPNPNHTLSGQPHGYPAVDDVVLLRRAPTGQDHGRPVGTLGFGWGAMRVGGRV
eukprot:GHVS01034998.1.p1 GENE.GHVS01034998.1~~GHVS01034998.1.p1  ORF type:complete len:121 (+),score=2.44 GHVS01034998.1:529-891(+)